MKFLRIFQSTVSTTLITITSIRIKKAFRKEDKKGSRFMEKHRELQNLQKLKHIQVKKKNFRKPSYFFKFNYLLEINYTFAWLLNRSAKINVFASSKKELCGPEEVWKNVSKNNDIDFNTLGIRYNRETTHSYSNYLLHHFSNF